MMNVKKRTGYQYPACAACKWFRPDRLGGDCGVMATAAAIVRGNRTCRAMFDPQTPGPGSVEDRMNRYARAAVRWWRKARVNSRVGRMLHKELARQANWMSNPPETVLHTRLVACEAEREKLRKSNDELLEIIAATNKG